MGPCAAPGCPAPRPRRAGHQSQSAACVEDREEPPTAGLPAPGSRRRCPPLSGVGHRRPPPSAGHRPVSARASGCPCLASGHSRWTFGTGRGRGSVVVASPPPSPAPSGTPRIPQRMRGWQEGASVEAGKCWPCRTCPSSTPPPNSLGVRGSRGCTPRRHSLLVSVAVSQG